MKRVFVVSAIFGAVLSAQNFQRQATFVGGGSPDRGRCTVEVVVDRSAQVELRGASATLRTLAGQPAQWRRFECTSTMPVNPANLRFAGVDGRGRQALIGDPRNGGAVVVQIDDPNGGAEAYTFDITWDMRGLNAYDNRPPNYADRPGNVVDDDGRYRYPEDRYRPNYRDSEYYRRYGHGFGVDEAVRLCEDAVFDQAQRRYRTRDIHFERTAIDNNPGRNDWVTGTLDVHTGGPRGERYGFSCSVNFETGRVRTANLDPRPLGGTWR